MNAKESQWDLRAQTNLDSFCVSGYGVKSEIEWSHLDLGNLWYFIILVKYESADVVEALTKDIFLKR